jgi:putative hydrolase of the HAD superfamily
MSGVKVVLFDLGNVLVTFKPETFWQSLGLFSPNQQTPFAAKVKSASHQFERGELSKDDFFHRLGIIFDGKFATPQLRTAFGSVLTTPIKGMENILTNMQTRAHTGLVSNTNAHHWEYCQKTIPAIDRFQAHYLSFKIRAMKPDPMFYSHVLNAEKLPANQILFVDDVEANVAGAERAGMRVHLFKTVEQLKERLKVFGLA